ncbi:choloylglycine hydrolase family protein [Lactiplantibacillus sp. WILCCON 0030]|uniref:Choloylglycine hydrolase family protein n=1 Tax=Lactiplantibacillus brownii TaxID=3069269 RepID=A0ABU1AC56_9LACO|nr:choloylglycine hydrolase family protein [Lactiplantibacillus brownii]MDQ7938541.1 choloylglycine hydrolase family protein [Lactiplantibacillus brownii]
MCTSLTYQTSGGDQFLARTMDFGFELGGRPVVIPRQHHFTSVTNATGFDAPYSFAGTGRDLNGYILVDGVNEYGVSAAALYFAGQAHYAAEPVEGQINLAPHEVVMWILGNVKSTAELSQRLADLTITESAAPLLNIVVPLHWIISDRQGETFVLEQEADGMHYMKNPVGVMTNSPDFDWHLKNLSNYVELQPMPHTASRQYGDLTVNAFGPGTGALGMPGDYTSPSRFIRTVFNREHTETVDTDAAAVNTLSHMLNSVEIPKGVKVKADGSDDYTQYRAYMSMNEPAFYMQPYNDQTITRVALTEAVMTADTPTEYALAGQQQFKAVN